MFLHYIPRIPHLQKDVTEIAQIKENFSRLFLLGEGFQDGDLDKALEQSDEIRDSVLKLLFGVGEILIHGDPKTSFPLSLLNYKNFKTEAPMY